MSLIRAHQLLRQPYYKLLRPDWVHNDFRYRKGWNTDTYPLVADGTCGAGGLYFGTLAGCASVLGDSTDVNRYWLARVMLAPDEWVWRENEDKMKARTICVTEATKIRTMPNLLYQHVFVGLTLEWPRLLRYFDWRKVEDKKGFARELVWLQPDYANFIPQQYQ